MKIPEELAVLRDAREAEAGISFDVAVRGFLKREQAFVDGLLARFSESVEGGYFRILVPTDIIDERFLVIRSAAYGAGFSGSVFHCFVDTWTGDILRHAGWGHISQESVGHVFDGRFGYGKLPYDAYSAVPTLPEGAVVRDKNGELHSAKGMKIFETSRGYWSQRGHERASPARIRTAERNR